MYRSRRSFNGAMFHHVAVFDLDGTLYRVDGCSRSVSAGSQRKCLVDTDLFPPADRGAGLDLRRYVRMDDAAVFDRQKHMRVPVSTVSGDRRDLYHAIVLGWYRHWIERFYRLRLVPLRVRIPVVPGDTGPGARVIGGSGGHSGEHRTLLIM